MVVTDLSGQALALLPSSQTGPLPVVPSVEEDADLDEVVRELAPQLLERQEMAGAVVLRDGEIRGVLPRALIAERARRLLDFQTNRSLSGNPLVHRPVYACPQGDYEKPVSYYDPSDPPRCPSHGDLLVRKV